MNTLRKMNRPIKFFGLTAIQFGLYVVFIMFATVVMIAAGTHSLMIVMVIAGYFFFSGLVFKKLSAEHKLGNPDYIKGLSIKSATPRKITDRKHIFRFIYNA